MKQIEQQSLNTNDHPKILMIVGSLGAGGKERQIIALLKGLKKSGVFSTYIAVLNPSGLREIEASYYADQVIPIKRISSFDLLTPLIHLVSFTKKEKIRLIHTWGSGIWDLSGLLVARSCHIPFLHGGIRSSPTNLNFSNYLSRLSALRADAIVANSQAGLAAFGVEKNPRAKVIYNGIDMVRFKGLDTYSGENNLCMVANFSDKKDHQSLVSALPLIINSFPDVELTLVGHDAGTLDQVRSSALELGVLKYIEFETDTLKPESFIAKSRIGILATHGEGTSNALLEYMALSKPVIVSDNGGNREVVINGVNGYLIEAGSPRAISDHVIRLLEDKALAKQMGRAGRDLVLKKYNIQSMVDAFEELYLDSI